MLVAGTLYDIIYYEQSIANDDHVDMNRPVNWTYASFRTCIENQKTAPLVT